MTEEKYSSSNGVKRRRVIELMFTKFAIAYRGLWHKDLQEARYAEFAKKEWEKHLKHFPDSVISTVTELCAKKLEMPPTMAQFISLCKNEVNRHSLRKKERFKKSNPETAIHHLNKMKGILRTRR